MSLGLRLHVTNTSDGTTFERVFERFPVRIGRHPLSDFQLDLPYVSQFHAILDLEGRQLMLRDLGSSNGTLLRHVGRIPPNQPVDLATSDYEFAILGLVFRAFAVEVAEQKAPRRMRGSRFAIDPAELAEMRALPASAVADAKRDLQRSIEVYRASWASLHEQLSHRAAALPMDQRAQLLEELAATSPALAHEPDFQRMAAFVSAKVERPAGAAGSEESLTFQVLREFAGSFVEGATIESSKDAIAFLVRVQETVDTFLEAFVPMRDGHRQFRTQLDIDAHAPSRSDPSAAAIDDATSAKQVARALLDWRGNASDSTHALRSALADIMMHQVALVDGVMRGVKSLLGQLSPAAIEAVLEKRGSGLRIGPFRFEALWRVFVERHGDLADEEKEAFRVIFGADFVRAYTQFGRSVAPPRSIPLTMPPPRATP